jgi:transposase-like protein|tara:strand:- start:19 stop:267 length:249 start_codon:yes stop_codon:yes gene_type:complete
MNEKWGKETFGGGLNLHAEVVNGVCPACQSSVVLVSLYKYLYRCVKCGSDLEQKVNGVISYIPTGNPNTKIVLSDSNVPQKS